MIDHIGLTVSDYETSKEFYLKALAPLDIGIVIEVPAEASGSKNYLGLGNHENPFFWISEGDNVTSGLHVAFTAGSRAIVDAFYEAALAAGGKDNGAPGLRPHYHEHYYGAFIFDPDGNNIEAVCHEPDQLWNT